MKEACRIVSKVDVIKGVFFILSQAVLCFLICFYIYNKYAGGV